MTKYCLIDLSNLMHRAVSVLRKDEPDPCGVAMGIAFESIKKARATMRADHLVVALDHSSWRKEVFDGYKAKDPKDVEERKEDFEKVFDTIGVMKKYFSEDTNVTVLHARRCEADDFIARWIQLHPTDEHVVISSDRDYKQLVAHNVELFNGITNTLYDMTGVYFQDGMKPKKGQQVKVIYDDVWKVKCDKKGVPEEMNPGWELFYKIMIGDDSDKIPRAAVPRTLTKNLRAAYDNPDGITMSNIMASYRDDLEGRPAVREVFERNKFLIDLREQPEDVKEVLDSEILRAVDREPVKDVARKFLMFCKEHRLIRIGENARKFVPMFTTPYRS